MKSLDNAQIDPLLNSKSVVDALNNALYGLLDVLVVNVIGSKFDYSSFIFKPFISNLF